MKLSKKTELEEIAHAVGDIKLGGISTPWNPPPLPLCYPVFISSDSTRMFGHQCPSCNGY